MDQILDELTFHMERKNWIPRISMTRSPISMESLYNCSPRKNCGMFRLTASIICYLLCEAQGAIYPKYWPTEDIDAFLTSHDDLRHEVFKMIRAQRNEMAFEEQVFYPGCRFHEHEEGQPCSQRTARWWLNNDHKNRHSKIWDFPWYTRISLTVSVVAKLIPTYICDSNWYQVKWSLETLPG